ncbi:hypothetical protein LTR53_007251 [Teratosphaeriaceae sp. CCFEE 6253]|nr:hypothetical protein LTR53_007251 [Teratosphaeriaceae sp. CCFEE 6253]
MAIRASIRNITSITDVSDMPYGICRPILRKINNPDQLHEIEINSPQIADSDAELWRAFIARDIPNWQDKIVEPKNPRSWWKVYRKLTRDETKAKGEQEEKLRAAMSGLTKKREENKATYVERVLPMKAREKAFVDGVRNLGAGEDAGAEECEEGEGCDERNPAAESAGGAGSQYECGEGHAILGCDEAEREGEGRYQEAGVDGSGEEASTQAGSSCALYARCAGADSSDSLERTECVGGRGEGSEEVEGAGAGGDSITCSTNTTCTASSGGDGSIEHDGARSEAAGAHTAAAKDCECHSDINTSNTSSP